MKIPLYADSETAVKYASMKIMLPASIFALTPLLSLGATNLVLYNQLDLTSLPGWPSSIQPGDFPELDSDEALPRGLFTVTVSEEWPNEGEYSF